MHVDLKPIDQQVIVITGASSGIGLATARRAVEQVARVVLTSRSADALEKIVQQFSSDRAIHVEGDVCDRGDLDRVADAAMQTFGRIDTWVNNAGIAIYGRLEQVMDIDSRKLFETNFWGVVYGSLVALPHLKRQGGALINIGSEVSEAIVPLLGMYNASKHAVKGFTDTLRVELDMEKAPVSVTLIQPTAVDTPFPEHARNYMEQEPDVPAPRLDPRDVADAILKAAHKPIRAIRVGSMSRINTTIARLAPALGEKMAAKQASRLHRDEPARNPEGSLFHPRDDGRTRARPRESAREQSPGSHNPE